MTAVPTITDEQVRAYLLRTGWHEHAHLENRGMWERQHTSGASWSCLTAPLDDVHGAVATISQFEGREVREVLRDVRMTFPVAMGGLA
jgi:hypothetical protein